MSKRWSYEEMKKVIDDIRELVKDYQVPVIVTRQQGRGDTPYMELPPTPSIVIVDYVDVLRSSKT